jgi:hypothetical protein
VDSKAQPFVKKPQQEIQQQQPMPILKEPQQVKFSDHAVLRAQEIYEVTRLL